MKMNVWSYDKVTKLSSLC